MSATGRSLNNQLHDIAALRKRVARLELALGILVSVLALHMLVKFMAEIL